MGFRPSRKNPRLGRRQDPTARLLHAIAPLTSHPHETAVLASLAVTAAGLGAYGYWVEPFWLDVTYTSISLANLAPSFDGLTLAHLSDIHLPDKPDPRSAAARAVAWCNETRPDVVVLTGDYLANRSATDALVALLNSLEIRPAYAVFGNHDYRFGRAAPTGAGVCRRWRQVAGQPLGVR